MLERLKSALFGDPHEWQSHIGLDLKPVMRRKDANGAWEYRPMTADEESEFVSREAF